MNDAVEVQQGIFEFNSPKEVDTDQWLEEHLDCDTIADYKGNKLIVYAFTLDPRYNYALEEYKESKRLDKQHILGGISSDGLNSLISLT
ncbi:MAG: hypothetical protein J5819_09895 [Eubacterium sp.]|nr:hypothetical protein [Eubacterium sp.]